MNIVKWTPFRELENMQTRLNRFFGDAPLRAFEADPPFFADWAPPVDVEETDKEYLIKAELPDIPKENVKVEMLDGVLTIEGERKLEKEEKGRKFHKVERSYGKFIRQFALRRKSTPRRSRRNSRTACSTSICRRRRSPPRRRSKSRFTDLVSGAAGSRPLLSLYDQGRLLPSCASVRASSRRHSRVRAHAVGPAPGQRHQQFRSCPAADRTGDGPRPHGTCLQDHRKSPPPAVLGKR
jgi:HSP20 family protein